MVEQAALQLGKLENILFLLDPCDIGVAPQRAGGRTGRIQQNRIERLGLKRCRVASQRFGVQIEPCQIVRQAFQADRRAVNRQHIGAGQRQLGGLAPRCRAEIGNPFAFLCPQQAGGQAGCGILNPEGAFGIAGQT